jgi:hypothetical protein
MYSASFGAGFASVLRADGAVFSLTKEVLPAKRTSLNVLVAQHDGVPNTKDTYDVYYFKDREACGVGPVLSLSASVSDSKFEPRHLLEPSPVLPSEPVYPRPFAHPSLKFTSSHEVTRQFYGFCVHTGAQFVGNCPLEGGFPRFGPSVPVAPRAFMPCPRNDLSHVLSFPTGNAWAGPGDVSWSLGGLEQHRKESTTTHGHAEHSNLGHSVFSTPYQFPTRSVDAPSVSAQAAPGVGVPSAPPPATKKRAKERDPNKPRRKMKLHYNCRECGELKKGHICAFSLKY